MPVLTSLAKKLASSTFVWILLILAVLDVGIVVVKPLRLMNASNLTGINQNPVVAKLREFLDSSRNPDVVVVGSSLTLVPAVRLDDQFHGVRTRYDHWYARNHVLEYDKADFLAHLLSEKAGRAVEVANLGVVGSLMSDHFLVVDKVLAAGKKPRLIVCMVAPRDFMDNTRSEIDKTPVYSILADFTAFNDLLAKNPAPDRIFDFVVGNSWKFYKMRVDVKTILTTWACHTFDRQASLFLANKFAGQKANPNDVYLAGPIAGVLDEVKAVYDVKPNTLIDLGEYKSVYLPVNKKMISEQTPYLERLLKRAGEEQVPVVLVESPLTRENLALLPAGEIAEYRLRLRRAAATYGALLINPVGDYTLADFEDSCHMNARGGGKFYDALVKSIVSDPALAQNLTSGRLLGQR
ncbi:MAG: hypothetical protein K2Y22_08960 [Candidatus Obscuribacterales bacterium]|nr:hypothetical protein [Candidatus Obscuribacterales bacterium]